jgi:hypothetical protein
MKAFGLAMATVQLLSAFCSPVSAGSFRNAYLSFELPPAWKCNSEGMGLRRYLRGRSEDRAHRCGREGTGKRRSARRL